MELDVKPAVQQDESAVIRAAVLDAGARLVGRPDAYTSPWRLAAALEAVDRAPAAPRYAPSPRSTRGATRA